MLAGSISAFQGNGAINNVPIYTPPTNSNSTRILASGTTMHLNAQSPSFITFYDGVNTTVVLPDRTTIPLGTTYTFANPGAHANFSIAVQDYQSGLTLETVLSGRAWVFVSCDNSGSAVDASVWQWRQYFASA